MEMEIQIDGTAETLDKCHRPWLDVGSRTASCDGFVHIILSDRGTDDRMDLRGEVLRGHPVPQGEGAPLNWRPSADAVAGTGTDTTHWRVGTQGMICSTRWAAVWAMRRPAHDGQNPRRLQLKASSNSWWQVSQPAAESRARGRRTARSRTFAFHIGG